MRRDDADESRPDEELAGEWTQVEYDAEAVTTANDACVLRGLSDLRNSQPSPLASHVARLSCPQRLPLRTSALHVVVVITLLMLDHLYRRVGLKYVVVVSVSTT